MDARSFDAPTPTVPARRRRRVHGRRGLWFMNRRSTVGSLVVVGALGVTAFGLNMTVGSVGIAEGMVDVDVSGGLPDSFGQVVGEGPWTLDVPPGSVIPGVTVSLPLAIPPHSAAAPVSAVEGLEVAHRVDPVWVSTVRDEAAKEVDRVAAAGPRRVLCDDESTPEELRSMCE